MRRRDPGVPSDLSAITDSNAAVIPSMWRAPADGYGGTRNNQSNYRAAVSYMTGRHAIKIGLTLQQQWRINSSDHNNSVNYTFNNGVPNELTQYAEPARFAERVNYNLGLYAQDQWTVRRLTLNLGLRADFLNSQVDPQHLPAGPFIGERDFRRSTTCPIGRTCPRDWVWRTTCSATARPRSRPRSPGKSGRVVHDRARRQPGGVDGQQHHTLLDRQEWELYARLRPDPGHRERRVRIHERPQVRPDDRGHEVRRGLDQRLRRSAVQLGSEPRRPAPALSPRYRLRRLLPPMVRQLQRVHLARTSP